MIKRITGAVLAAMFLLTACGNTTGAAGTETTTAVTDAATEAQATMNVPEERDWDRIPTVMVDGVLYQSTGYVSSAIGCGNMDGEITSTVDGAGLPSKNDQSNFGSGYQYQRSSEGQIIVVMDGMRIIFRDPKHPFASDIPEEVLNFSAEVLEVRNGSLLVSVMDAPEMFMLPVTGECEVRTNAEIQKDDVAVGDTIRVWTDGSVEEVYPPIMPNVYRIVKEEQEAPKELIGMPNPWTDHKTITEAEEAVGFSFTLPSVLAGNKAVLYRAMGESIIEVIFEDADGKEAYRIRKGKGKEDISGDYNTYSVMHDLTVDGIDIDMQGEDDGIHRISFSSGKYAYSFTAGSYVASEEEAETLIAEIIERNEDFRNDEEARQNADGTWSYEPSIDFGTSKLFSDEERQAAADLILKEFAGWDGCELHQLWYTSDEQCNAENIKWMNELAEGQGLEPNFIQCIQFKSNYHSPVDSEQAGAWNPDDEYMNWEWWLARGEDGEWHLMTWGY